MKISSALDNVDIFWILSHASFNISFSSCNNPTASQLTSHTRDALTFTSPSFQENFTWTCFQRRQRMKSETAGRHELPSLESLLTCAEFNFALEFHIRDLWRQYLRAHQKHQDKQQRKISNFSSSIRLSLMLNTWGFIKDKEFARSFSLLWKVVENCAKRRICQIWSFTNDETFCNTW